jgi:hypothetical protein
VTSLKRALEVLRKDSAAGSDAVALVEEVLTRWERDRAEMARRMDRLTANQREMHARLWKLEDSRVFRILQRIGIVSGVIKARVASLVNPGAAAREKQRVYQRWLQSQPIDMNMGETNMGALSYQPRFRVLTVQDGSAASLNKAALETASDYLLLMSPGSRLTSTALFDLAAELQQERFEVLYGDEDSLSPLGARRDPIFKPEWSSELIFSPLYMGRFLVVSTVVFQAIGGFREGAQGAYLFDLALRLSEQPVRFHHVARVLMSVEKDSGSPAGTKAALEHFVALRSLAATVEPSGNGFAIRRRVEGTPLVSIVICSRRATLLKKCLQALEHGTAYPSRETIVVEHLTEEKNQLDAVLARSACIRVPYSGSFNFAAMNNLGAKAARGDVIVFLNDDVRPLHNLWLDAMVAQAQRPEVGVVGALLIYPSGAIQHAGIALGLMGTAGHPGRGTFDGGFWTWTAVTRNVSAVTGACVAMRREVFEELNGFDPLFPVNYNDVDLCLRARQAGYEVILEALARLWHLESGTRSLGVAWQEHELFAEKWGTQIGRNDPYYSPHLTVGSEDCSLA